MEISGTILNILKQYHTDYVAYVKIGNELSVPTKVTKGCSFSPILFNFWLKKKTLDHWKNCQEMGMPMKENKCLLSLN